MFGLKCAAAAKRLDSESTINKTIVEPSTFPGFPPPHKNMSAASFSVTKKYFHWKKLDIWIVLGQKLREVKNCPKTRLFR